MFCIFSSCFNRLSTVLPRMFTVSFFIRHFRQRCRGLQQRLCILAHCLPFLGSFNFVLQILKKLRIQSQDLWSGWITLGESTHERRWQCVMFKILFKDVVQNSLGRNCRNNGFYKLIRCMFEFSIHFLGFHSEDVRQCFFWCLLHQCAGLLRENVSYFFFAHFMPCFFGSTEVCRVEIDELTVG